MSSKRLHLVLLIALALSFAALVGGAYMANTLLSKQAHELTTLKARSLALTQQQQSLSKSKKEVAKYSDLEKITRAIVPEDKNQAAAVRELVAIADNNHIALSSITFPASSLGTGKVGTAPAAGSSPAASTSSSQGAGASTSTGTLSQLIPVKNIPGVYQLVIAVQSDPSNPVRYNNFINFLKDLEHNRRTAQVSNVTLTPDSNDPNSLTFTLNINEYIKP